MKKSKIVNIGLLALSIASCTHKRVESKHISVQEWSDGKTSTDYYVRTDQNQQYSGGNSGFPVWLYLLGF